MLAGYNIDNYSSEQPRQYSAITVRHPPTKGKASLADKVSASCLIRCRFVGGLVSTSIEGINQGDKKAKVIMLFIRDCCHSPSLCISSWQHT